MGHNGLRLRIAKEGGWACDHCKREFMSIPAKRVELTRVDDQSVIFDGRIVICPECASSLGSALSNLAKLAPSSND